MNKRLQGQLVSYSFITPFFIVFTVFVLVPVIYVFYLSFQTGTFIDQIFSFVGLKNFKTVFQSDDFINSFRNSLLYILVEVPFSQILALFLAILIRHKSKPNAVFETVFFLPILVSMVAASVVIAYVLSNRGPANFLLSLLNIPPVNWLGHPTIARFSVMILEVWKGGTFFIFIYMAALRALPIECSEAAKIDGASSLQETFLITLPLLKNSIILCVIMNTIWQFQIFESVYMLTGGGPLDATETVVYTIYQYSFMFDKIGVGSAASVLFLFVILVVAGIQALLLKARD